MRKGDTDEEMTVYCCYNVNDNKNKLVSCIFHNINECVYTKIIHYFSGYTTQD